MGNLPVRLPAIKAYDGSPLTIRLDMYSGFVVPAQMAFEVYYNRVFKYSVTPTYNSTNRQLTASFTAEQIQEMPLIADVKIKFDSNYPFEVQIKPTSEGSDNGVVGYTIQQSGDSYTVIEIYAKDEIDAQVDIATQKAEQAGIDAAAAHADRLAAEQAKNDVHTGLGAKANYKSFSLLSDLIFPLPEGIVIIKQDTTFGAPQVQFYYSDGTASAANDLYMVPTSKRSEVING